jgi:hypothetical protein
MVGFYRELCDQLTVNCFDDLADPVVEATCRCRDLYFLVAARLGEQADAIVLPEFISDRCTDVRFVADDDAVSVIFQEFATEQVSKEVDLGQHHAPHLIHNRHQVTSPPIEAALLRQDGKLIPMCLHMIE